MSPHARTVPGLPHRRSLTARAAAGIGAIALLATGLIALPLAQPARAADFTVPDVDTDAEYRAALADCDAGTPGDTCTIEITGPFAVDGAGGSPFYDGLMDVVIVGVGAQHSITRTGALVPFLRASGLGSITIENLAFSGFTLTNEGGAVINLNGPDLTLHGVSMTNNTSNTSEMHSADGGAIRSTLGSVAIYDSTFEDNFAEGNDAQAWSGTGGVVFTSLGAIHLERSTFTDNGAQRGGGVASTWAGSITVVDSTFDINDADWGGVISQDDGGLTVTGSTFTGNTASAGGAIYTSSDISITNSTFDANVASVGGAVYTNFSFATLTHVTLTDNEATSQAAHIFTYGSAVTLRATVLGAPAGGSACGIFSGGSFISGGYNWATTTSCLNGSNATDVVNGTDPGLSALADNAGTTHTRLPAWTSPLRDAIPLSETAPAADQRGVTRAQGAGFDIGAVEVVHPSVTFTVHNNNADAVAEFTVDGASSVDEVEWFAVAGYTPVAPAGVTGPLGIMGFELTVPAPGESVEVTAVLLQPVNQVWKDVNGTWVEVTDAVIAGNTVTYELTDGGPLDSDGVANGVIVDPVLFGVGAAFTG